MLTTTLFKFIIETSNNIHGIYSRCIGEIGASRLFRGRSRDGDMKGCEWLGGTTRRWKAGVKKGRSLRSTRIGGYSVVVEIGDA